MNSPRLETTYDDSRRIAYLSSGKNILNFHTIEYCSNKNCPVHHPREHEYSDLPLDWVAGSFVRLSPSFHGGMMIDPDDFAYNSGRGVIIRNSAQCGQCGNEVISTYTHDFRSCECGNVSVDGGHSYVRHLMENPELYKNTSITFKKDLSVKE